MNDDDEDENFESIEIMKEKVKCEEATQKSSPSFPQLKIIYDFQA